MTPLVTSAAIGFRAGCEELVDNGADMNYIVERTGFLDLVLGNYDLIGYLLTNEKPGNKQFQNASTDMESTLHWMLLFNKRII